MQPGADEVAGTIEIATLNGDPTRNPKGVLADAFIAADFSEAECRGG
jgi:hypothetical protein